MSGTTVLFGLNQSMNSDNPENIVAISDENEIVTSYTIYNMVADTKRYLTSCARSKI